MIRNCVSVLGLIVLVACGNSASTDGTEPSREEGPAETLRPPSRERSETPAVPTAPTSPEAAAPSDACERALACCPAYLEAVPEAARREANEACATLALATQLEGRARDEACQGARDGFRRAFTQFGLELPEACR